MSNENCLKGIRCPKCGQEDMFYIVGTATFELTDDGASEFQNLEWDDESMVRCPQCNWWGKRKEFSSLARPWSWEV